jgi:dTDP-4-amino-4,6-dideoxygalactose transaminase
VYGYPCDVEAIAAIARRRGLKVIYDGAHAFDTTLDGTPLATFGDATILSFHATKLFHTVEGGAIAISDAEVAKRAALLRAFGHVNDDYYSVGTNAKASEIHAAMGLCMLPRVKEIIARRKVLSQKYDALLRSKDLRLPVAPPGLGYNYSYYPVVFASEAVTLRVKGAMADAGIGTRRYFYPSLNRLPYLASTTPCPISEDVCTRVLCLPLYDGLSVEDVERICGIVAASLGG